MSLDVCPIHGANVKAAQDAVVAAIIAMAKCRPNASIAETEAIVGLAAVMLLEATYKKIADTDPERARDYIESWTKLLAATLDRVAAA